MERRVRRLVKLQKTLDRLRKVLMERVDARLRERQQLLNSRATIERLMSADTRFLDLTTGGALRRLQAISARLSVIDAEVAKYRKRAVDSFLKAKRAGALAVALRASGQAAGERRRLAEISDRASLPQVKEA